MEDPIAEALTDCFISPNSLDSNMEPANVVDAIQRLGTQIKYLGGGDNGDNRGAVEVLAISVKEAGDRIASAIEDLASAIREGNEK
jgi:hypothetical protein